MNADDLLAHFGRIADAPDAIARLRRFILDLAVRGKLVPQDAFDEPAVELLKRIAKEKARLVKAREIRTPKPIRALSKTPFPIPANWRWSQLAEIGVLSPRNEAPDAHEASFVPMPMIAAEYGIANEHEVRAWGEIKKGYTHFAEGDVGLAKITPCFENGKSTVFRNLTGGIGSGTTELHIVRPLFVDQDYILLFLKSPHFIENGIPRMTGTAGQKRVPTEYFAYSPFPLPPLPEQRRIVAKVDELMALCDRLDATQGGREAVRDRLAAASLAGFEAPDPETFQEAARFAIDALPALTTRPDQIKQLRQTILSIAVRGKLVPQDPKDKPASKMLSEKASLPDGYQRRRKILKKTSVHAPDHLFPSIPSAWAYADVQTLYDLNAIIDYADGNHGSLYPRSSEFGESGVTFVTAKDLAHGRVVWDSCAKLNQKRANQLTKGWAQGGDILLTHNATVGRVAQVEPCVGRFLLGTSVTFYRLNSKVIDPGYFSVVLTSPAWQGQLEAIMAQTTRNQVSIQKQAFFKVAVPPLGEQHRIVAKVDELMALCDKLEASLTTADETRRRLLEALLAEALEPDEERELEAAE
ncbi:restriction endonuclease subunit S [Bradyrhizobium ottawaense]|uniref:restriction endonuclease subunit S n=1 Tax=Bradyrhizobium ottawaense TaxID=931866 RepID=UPI001BAA27DA|nr:restriction endonuclease subunit S [Bradyrhizobium ottawaense]MBR1329893.1 restriction endonuclease subunit S [Bradyrhizobium ottawaense]